MKKPSLFQEMVSMAQYASNIKNKNINENQDGDTDIAPDTTPVKVSNISVVDNNQFEVIGMVSGTEIVTIHTPSFFQLMLLNRSKRDYEARVSETIESTKLSLIDSMKSDLTKDEAEVGLQIVNLTFTITPLKTDKAHQLIISATGTVIKDKNDDK